ncbi:MAG: tripartite tricarboxylate transporter substrate-binding protein [Rhodospirillaceae bacterium]|jgi:tripartite-type tricarboxylate transporter receptor subunit TctC
MRNLKFLALSSACLTATVTAGPAQADAVADFYKDRQVTAISGGGAGGGFSLVARVLGRHIGENIPGKPNWVVTAMPGAGGARSVKYIVNAAAQDGTVVGVVLPPAVISPLLRPKVGYDSKKLQWIGSVTPMASVLTQWHTSPAKSLDAIKKTEVTTATSSKLSTGYFFPAWLNHTVGTKFKIIAGYRGGDRQNNAMEKGEVNGRSSFYNSYKSTKPHWIAEKKIVQVAYMGPRTKDLADAGVPNIMDLMKTDQDRAVIQFLQTGPSIGHGFFVSPGVPKARVAALRAAFNKTVGSKKFLDDATKRRIVVDPVKGEDLDKVVAAAFSTPKATVDYFKKSVGFAALMKEAAEKRKKARAKKKAKEKNK